MSRNINKLILDAERLNNNVGINVAAEHNVTFLTPLKYCWEAKRSEVDRATDSGIYYFKTKRIQLIRRFNSDS